MIVIMPDLEQSGVHFLFGCRSAISLWVDNFWNTPLAELLGTLEASNEGLTSQEVARRQKIHGLNSLEKESRFVNLLALGRFIANPLIVILLIASAISLALGDAIGGSIIIAMVLLSISLNFFMEFQARNAVELIRKQTATTAEVTRDGKLQEISIEQLVPGDVITLNAGDLVPADARLLTSKDLHVRESALTGESLPTPKKAADLEAHSDQISEATNSLFLGTSVQSGLGQAVIVRTGKNTAFAEIARRLTASPPETEFARGIRQFGSMITKVILLLVLFVLLVNILFRRPLLESFLFAVALAVGMTPELMPVIITVTLAQGARRMMKKKVLVKQLAAIEDFGSIDILCSDKTGTLTEGEIVLDRHVDIHGKDNDEVLRLVYLNSFFEAGIKSPMDAAVLKHAGPPMTGYEKLDEIPFDFTRKRLSVVIKMGEDHTLITKGDLENVLEVCNQVWIDGKPETFGEELRKQATATFQSLSGDGYRILGVATKVVPQQTAFTRDDEKDLTLAGFAAFLDPPKEGIAEVLRTLKENGVSVVIMTGDNQYVTQKIAADVGLSTQVILTGVMVDGMDNAALAHHAENSAIFARMSPEQKYRVIAALKERGHVVGYMGDGINDAPSLHIADVGISVMNGVEVAKDAAKIILLEKDLSVLNDGIIEGRRSFANIMKYIVMGTSSNFGNMFSMAAASLFLPFLPMLPTQILLNNFLYDLSQISIPADNVDPALLHKPKRWRIEFVQQFMMIIGPISSIYDFLTFAILFWGFHAANNPSLFHTGWFVESLATQTLVVFVIRTAGNPFSSRPSRGLLLSVVAVVAAAVIIPNTELGALLKFTPLPMALVASIALLAITYLALVQAVKNWFYRHHSLL